MTLTPLRSILQYVGQTFGLFIAQSSHGRQIRSFPHVKLTSQHNWDLTTVLLLGGDSKIETGFGQFINQVQVNRDLGENRDMMTYESDFALGGAAGGYTDQEFVRWIISLVHIVYLSQQGHQSMRLYKCLI